MRFVCLKIKLINITQQWVTHIYHKGDLLGFMQDCPVLLKSITRLQAGSCSVGLIYLSVSLHNACAMRFRMNKPYPITEAFA